MVIKNTQGFLRLLKVVGYFRLNCSINYKDSTNYTRVFKVTYRFKYLLLFFRLLNGLRLLNVYKVSKFKRCN